MKHQNKAGKSVTGLQSYCRMQYICIYLSELKCYGSDEDICRQALRLYVGDMNLRRTGRQLGINNRTVSLWIKSNLVSLPEAKESGS
jgi:transposase-like protein